MRVGSVHINQTKVGQISEDNGLFQFKYDDYYLSRNDARAISLTLPLRKEAYTSKVLFPFFCGLLAEGVNKEMQCRLLKIDENDLFGLLLQTAHSDTIGAVTVKPKKQ